MGGDGHGARRRALALQASALRLVVYHAHDAYEVALPVAQRRRAHGELDLPPIQRAYPHVARLHPGPGPHLPTQGAHERPLLGGYGTVLLVARGIECRLLTQR